MASHTITPTGGVVCRSKLKAGLRRSPRGLRARTRLSLLLKLNLNSSLKTTWFHSAVVQFPRAWHHSKRRRRWWASRVTDVMGDAISNVLQPGVFAWFEKIQGLLVKVLSVPGWQLMK
ncbi:e3 ubiquitin-protein ligase RNF13 [Trichonephila clavipes]|nr:e3 ubiquitin-protein ligase RNF13 [Trichonephila clavipes]